MIALESMVRVNKEKADYVPSSSWNWKPDVSDPSSIDRNFIEASGKNTTSRNTFTKQMDHGENY